MNNEYAIRMLELQKWFDRNVEPVPALAGISLHVRRGEFVALVGPSGSGKSTLLHLIAGMDTPTSGIVEVFGRDISAMKDAELAKWRSERIGFVFQEFNLIPVLSALENVELPLRLRVLARHERMKRARTALELVGLESRLHHRPGQMSGGEQQRVAVARAIVTDPEIILADEPTGNLNSAAAASILELFRTLHASLSKTVVLVTHDQTAIPYAQRVYSLLKGVLSGCATRDEIGAALSVGA